MVRASEIKNKRRFQRLLTGLVCLLFLLGVSGALFVSSIKGNGKPVSRLPHRTTATPTSTKVVTSTVSPTDTVSLTPTPIFLDSFLDNKQGWAVSNDNDTSGYERKMDEGSLTLTDTNHRILIESLPTSTTFRDFTLTVDFTQLEGGEHDSFGLYLRGDSNLDHDYRIDIFANNTFAVSKELLDAQKKQQTESLIEPRESQALKPQQQQNTCVIIAKGPFLMLWLNGSLAATIVDSSYDYGQIALFVQNGATSDGVSTSIQRVQVEAAPDTLPGLPITPLPSATPTHE